VCGTGKGELGICQPGNAQGLCLDIKILAVCGYELICEYKQLYAEITRINHPRGINVSLIL